MHNIEEDIAEERLQFWVDRLDKQSNSQDAIDGNSLHTPSPNTKKKNTFINFYKKVLHSSETNAYIMYQGTLIRFLIFFIAILKR
jgi:hypothetical protein